MSNLMPTPDDARRSVRGAAWPNREAEAAATAAVDEAVFDKVRHHEAWLARQADALADKVKDTLGTASTLLGDVLELDNGVLHQEVDVTPRTAAVYKELRANVEKNIDDLLYMRKQIEHTAERAADPYRAVNDVLTKFAALRAGRSYIH